MKNKKIILAVFLAVTFLFSACVPQNTGSSSGTDRPGETVRVDDVVQKDGFIISNNRSDYKVVVSEEATEMERYAAQELVGYLYQSTGVTLELIEDTGLYFNESGRYLSVGETSLLTGSGVTNDYDDLKEDGFKIQTKGNAVIMVGGGDYGTLYSVYEFLSHTIDYHAYAVDEIFFNEKTEVPVYDFNIVDVPDIAERTISFYHVRGTETVKDAARMRLLAAWKGGTTIYEGGLWGLWSHSYEQLLPLDKYYDEHPEWFDGSGKQQICLTNDECRAELIKNLKQIILDTPNARYYSIGIRDNTGYCSCTTCAKDAEEHGGYGGVMMRFLNKISDEVTPWVESVDPTRKVYFIGLAYYQFDEAPVKIDESGNFFPVDETVVARDNVGVMYAPISACWGCPLNDPTCATNQQYSKKMKGWGKVTNMVAVWAYGSNFSNYFINLNNWGSIQGNYEFFKDCNAFYVLDQCAMETNTPLQDLRIYVQSQILWDTSQDPDALIDDFMQHYYKVAAPYIRQYYDYTRAHYLKLKQDGILTNAHIGPSGNNTNAKFWPYKYCVKTIGYFDQAITAIEESSYDSALKEKLKLRVLVDSLSVRFLILDNYRSYYSKTEYNEMVMEFEEICEKADIRTWHEGSWPVSELILKWWVQ